MEQDPNKVHVTFGFYILYILSLFSPYIMESFSSAPFFPAVNLLEKPGHLPFRMYYILPLAACLLVVSFNLPVHRS